MTSCPERHPLALSLRLPARRDLHRALMAAALTTVCAAVALAADPVMVPLTAEQQRAFGVELAAPLPAEETLTRRYPAQVAVPNRQLRVLSAPQAGVLDALLVAEGEQVEPGQVLARLRSPELVDAQSAYLEAVTRLSLAESQLARDRMLHEEGVIAERRLLESQSSQTELSTLVDQRRQLLQLVGLSAADIDALHRSRQLSSSLPVRTPIGGVVLEQMVSTGQSVATAAPLYRVAELNPLWVEVHVPVESLGGLAPGAPVLLPTLGIDGEIITVGRMVHSQDQGVLVRAEIKAGTEKLRPGQFVEVQLSAAAAAGASWRIPAAAVVRNAGAAFVFAARDGGFAVLPVEVLAEEERTIVVAGPLSADDRVAISGVVAMKAAWLAQPDAGAGTPADGGDN